MARSGAVLLGARLSAFYAAFAKYAGVLSWVMGCNTHSQIDCWQYKSADKHSNRHELIGYRRPDSFPVIAFVFLDLLREDRKDSTPQRLYQCYMFLDKDMLSLQKMPRI